MLEFQMVELGDRAGLISACPPFRPLPIADPCSDAHSDQCSSTAYCDGYDGTDVKDLILVGFGRRRRRDRIGRVANASVNMRTSGSVPEASDVHKTM